MTTDVINGVPRDDLDLIRAALEGFKPCIARDDALRTVRALLSAPSPAGVYSADPLACPGCASGCFRCASPAGVDGLETICVTQGGCNVSWTATKVLSPAGTALCRLSDAQAIIDGLRGEVERLQRAEKNDAIAYKAALERQDELRAELAALKAQGVVMPDRKTKADYGVYIDEFADEAAAIYNAALDEVARLNAATVQHPKCKTCDDNGRIGGPSFYAPDEGGEPCPDCSAPVQQVSVPDVSAMARILADRNADACNVNREDNWMIYGQDYIDDVTAMLAAAPSAGSQEQGE